MIIEHCGNYYSKYLIKKKNNVLIPIILSKLCLVKIIVIIMN